LTEAAFRPSLPSFYRRATSRGRGQTTASSGTFGSIAVAGPDDAVLVGVDGDVHPVAQAQPGKDAGDVALD
jgi:hypothetical protein